MNLNDLELLAAAFGVSEWKPNNVGWKAFLQDGTICIEAFSDGQRWSDVHLETMVTDEAPLSRESVNIRCNTRAWTGEDTDRWTINVYSRELTQCGPIVARALCFLGCEDPIVNPPYGSTSFELPQVTGHEKAEIGLQGREFRNSL